MDILQFARHTVRAQSDALQMSRVVEDAMIAGVSPDDFLWPGRVIATFACAEQAKSFVKFMRLQGRHFTITNNADGLPWAVRPMSKLTDAQMGASR